MAGQWADRMLKPKVLTGAALGLAAIILYTITLAPDILGHDVADWQGAAATAGISHAPGSPAYIVVAWIFTLFPVGSLPERVNFLSAVVGAIGVVGIYAFVLLLFDRLLPALISALTLMVAAQWWSYASVAQPYNAVVTIIIISLLLLLLWQRSGDVRLVWGGAFLLGFGIAYHPTLAYFLPVLLAGVFLLGPWRDLIGLRSLLAVAGFFLLGLGFLLYLPVRSAADPAISYAPIDSVSSFIDFVTARQARSTGHGVLSMPEWSELQDAASQVVRKGYYPSYAFLVFGPAIIMLHPAVWPELKRRRRWLLYLPGGMASHMFIVFIMSSQYSQYYMPMLLYFSIWAGFSVYLLLIAAEALGVERYRQVPALIAAAIYIGVLAVGIPHVWPFVDHSGDLSMRDYAEEVFAETERDGVILANWESYTGLRYLQDVEGRRKDLSIISVGPEGWRQLLTGIFRYQPSQVLYSRTLPFPDARGLTELSGPVYLSIKGRTYQDRSHGEPFPATVQLYSVDMAAQGFR